MRWKRHPTGKDLYKRRRRKFLFLPMTLAGETRWMETATIEEEKSFGIHEELKEVLDGKAMCRYCKHWLYGDCSLEIENEDGTCGKFELDRMWGRYIRRAHWEPIRFIDPLASIEIEEDPQLLDLIRQHQEEKKRREETYLKAAEEANKMS